MGRPVARTFFLDVSSSGDISKAVDDPACGRTVWHIVLTKHIQRGTGLPPSGTKGYRGTWAAAISLLLSFFFNMKAKADSASHALLEFVPTFFFFKKKITYSQDRI